MSDILRWQERKTRKPHRCWGCGKIHPAGTAMVNAAYADNRTIESCYWCNTCQEYMARHFKRGDEAEFAEIYNSDPEEWEKIKAELSKSEGESHE